VRGPLPLMEPWQFSYFYANILLWGPQARVVPVASPVYGHDPPRWWTHGCTYVRTTQATVEKATVEKQLIPWDCVLTSELMQRSCRIAIDALIHPNLEVHQLSQ
jgi:hypothetical protein